MERTTIKLLVGFLNETKLLLRNLSRPTLLTLNYWMPLSSKCSLFGRTDGKKRKKWFEPFSNAIRALFASHVLPRLAPSLLPSELTLPLTFKLPPPVILPNATASQQTTANNQQRFDPMNFMQQFATQVQQRLQTIVV